MRLIFVFCFTFILLLSGVGIRAQTTSDNLNIELHEIYNSDTSISLKIAELKRIKVQLEDIGDEVLISKANTFIGNTFGVFGLIDSASYYLQLGHKQALLSKDSLRIFGAKYSLMVFLGLDMEDPNAALVYYEQIQSEWFDFLPDNFKGMFLNAASTILFKLDEYESAILLANQGLAFAFAANDSIEIQNNFQSLADCAFYKNDIQRALTYADSALIFGENDLQGTFYAELIRAKAFAKLNDLNAVKSAIESARRIATKLDVPDLWLDYYYQSFLAYKWSGQTDSAIHNLEIYEEFFSTGVNDQSKARFDNLRELYEAEAREQQIERLAVETELAKEQKLLYQLAAIFALTMILALSLFFIQKTKAARKLSEQKIAKLEKEKEVLSLQTMLFAQEEERKRIAGDLHDSIGALLSTAKLHMSNIEEELQALSQLNLVESTRKIIEHASTEVRRVAHNMMPGVLTKLGLTEALEDFFEKLQESKSIKVNFIYNELPNRLESKQEVMLYRIVQEMVNNTIKHAKASRIDVHLKLNDGLIMLEYADDGVGFQAALMQDQSNFGLSGIKNRAKFIDASVELITQPKKGAKYIIKLQAVFVK